MRNNQPVTNREYALKGDDFLISRTNRRGRITYANPAFIEVSGFTREELIGAPHNIVRHPDMPEQAFENLWRTLKEGGTWIGLVKNRRKDGFDPIRMSSSFFSTASFVLVSSSMYSSIRYYCSAF